MSRLFPNAVRSCTSFFGFVLDLMGDGLRFLCLTGHAGLGPGIPEPVEMLLPTQPHSRYFFHKVAARSILGGLHHEYRWERVVA